MYQHFTLPDDFPEIKFKPNFNFQNPVISPEPTPFTVIFKKLKPEAIGFQYSRPEDACMDVYSAEECIIKAGETVKVSTGIALSIPNGFEGRIRGRSGLSSQGIIVHHGTIDYEYRGEIGVVITNTTDEPYHIHVGHRIAQFSIAPVYKMTMIEFAELDETKRGENGFGSSGV